ENGQITITPLKDFSGEVSVNVVITEKGTNESYVAFDRFDIEVEAVNDPPVVTAIADQTVDEDNSLTIALSATDVDAKIQLFDYAVEMSDPSKFNVGIDGSTARIIPNSNINGTFTVSVFADDRQGTATSRSVARIFNLNINAVNDNPEIVKSFASQKIVQGFPAYTLNMGAYFNDIEDGANLNYTTTGNDKIGLSFDGAIMTVTPAADFSGVEDVIIQASDGELSVQQSVTFVSVQQNANIQIVNDPGVITLEEDFGTHIFSLSDVFADQNNSGAVFSYDLVGGNFLNVSINETTGLVTVVAPVNFNGRETLYLVGSTGGQSSYTTFEINVNPVNDAPVIGALPSQVIQEDLSVSGLFVELSDIDNAFADLSVTASSSNTALLPHENISVVSGSGGYVIGVTPVANKSGIALVTLTGSDGILEVTSSFRVTVQAVNDRPEVIVSSINAATEDQAYSLDVSSLFSDVEGDVLTYEVIELPDWAKYTAGTVAGTPTNDDVETWVLTVRANDGNGGTITASYQLPVANVNDAPELVAALGSITAFQEDNWVFNFPTSNFRDVDAGDVLTYSFDKFPDWATVSGTQLSGMPGYDDIGDYELIMSVTDVAGEKVTDVATLSVAFTIYDVTVTVDIDQECSEGKKAVSASGAFTYNWYDADNNLIGTKQESLTLEPGIYEVVGVDAMDNTAPARVSFEVVECATLNLVEPEMSIYPNPTSDWLYIENLSENVEIRMFDAMGRMHNLDFQSVGSGFKVDMTTLPSGMYFIRTNVNNKIWKVIKKD
ncbi:MAG: tandem-95 repeat protein, partial [Cyclobacteriaceae bacterium]